MDGELLMSLGWNCYYHKSDTKQFKKWCLQSDVVGKNNNLATYYFKKEIKGTWMSPDSSTLSKNVDFWFWFDFWFLDSVESKNSKC